MRYVCQDFVYHLPRDHLYHLLRQKLIIFVDNDEIKNPIKIKIWQISAPVFLVALEIADIECPSLMKLYHLPLNLLCLCILFYQSTSSPTISVLIHKYIFFSKLFLGVSFSQIATFLIMKISIY